MVDHFPWYTQIQNCQLNSESNSEYIKMTIHQNHVGFILETKRRYNINIWINLIQHMNRMKKNDMDISLDTEKALDNIQHNFMIEPRR
jgi:hypothetical protein